jgi:cytochrome o ubiquinol oxidase operon protein cyoD
MAKQHDEKTFGSYVLGLVLCITLTLAAFGIVEYRLLDDTHMYLSLGALAIAQLFVQSICFLRLNVSAEGRWNLFPFLFTSFVVLLLVGGSMWVVYNLNYNMLIPS